MTDRPWFEHLCVGGDADGTEIQSLMPLPAEIAMLRDPFPTSGWKWLRVTQDWPNTITYAIDHEASSDQRRVYRPVEAT